MALYVDVAERILCTVANLTDLKKDEHLDIIVVLCDENGKPIKYKLEHNSEGYSLLGYNVEGGYDAPTNFFVRNFGALLERMTGGNEIVGFRCLPGDNREAASSYGGDYMLCILYLMERNRGNHNDFFTLDEISQMDNVDCERVLSACKLARDIVSAFVLKRGSL